MPPDLGSPNWFTSTCAISTAPGTRSGFAAAKGARIGKPYCRRSYWSCSAPTGGGSGQKTGYSPATSPDNPSAAHPSSGRESPHHSGESRNYAPQNRLKTIAKRGPSPDPTKTACYSYVGQRDIRTARNGSPHSPQGVLSGTPSFFDNFNRSRKRFAHAHSLRCSKCNVMQHEIEKRCCVTSAGCRGLGRPIRVEPVSGGQPGAVWTAPRRNFG